MVASRTPGPMGCGSGLASRTPGSLGQRKGAGGRVNNGGDTPGPVGVGDHSAIPEDKRAAATLASAKASMVAPFCTT